MKDLRSSFTAGLYFGSFFRLLLLLALSRGLGSLVDSPLRFMMFIKSSSF